MVKVNLQSAPVRSAATLLRWMMMSALVVAAAAVAVSAEAQERMHGPGGGMMFGGPPEQMGGRHIDHMLDGLGASDAQRTQIKQIAAAAAADLRGQREAGRALHERGMQIFAAPNIDAAAAESVRAQIQAQRDQASRRVLQAMLDIGKVLTPEQRAKLGERMKQRSAAMQERMQRMERMPHERPKQ